MLSMRALTFLTLFCLAGLFSLPVQAATTIDNVRVYRAPEYTRFVFDVSEPAQYQVLPDVAPGRVVIDFRGAALKANLETVDLKDSPVRRVRSGLQADGTIRVVLDLAVPIRVSSFALPPTELYGHRLVVDLYDLVPEAKAPVDAPAADAAAQQAGAAVALPPATAPVPPAGAPLSTPPALPLPATGAPPASLPSQASVPSPVQPLPPPSPAPTKSASATPVMAPINARAVVVAIDAGHGGEDPGAMGANKTREKDVVLAIARAVREQMLLEPGMRPVLIRDGDYYIGLKERRVTARRKHNADLFLSIHADAFARREARGASVFAVSRRGATSTLAAYLADSENRADLVGGVDPKTDNDLLNVLSDMMMEGTMRESLQLGRSVLDELGGFARLHKRGIEQAGFMVLKEPNMPSILIETGFISNPDEERLLTTVAYQQRLARAIVNGVRRYFDRYPPPGTWFAANREGRVVAQAKPAARVAGFVETASAGNSDAEDPDARPPEDALMALARSGSAPPSQKKPASAARPARDAYVMHTVGKGQSMGWLAKKYGVSQRDIKSANNLRRDDIRIGETLKIPKK